MAAIYMNRYLRRGGCSMTLVESADIGTIGVGEATVPSIVQFVRLLGLDEREFMRRCSATYKLGIRFDDWKRGGRHLCPSLRDRRRRRSTASISSTTWLKRKLDRKRAEIGYSRLQPACHGLDRDAGKAPAPAILEQGTFAFHLDAGALAQYLKELATAEGVQACLRRRRRAINRDPTTAMIESVDIGGDRRLARPISSSMPPGFRGRLIEQELGDPWIDWSRFMLCDSGLRPAAAAHRGDASRSPDATAVDAGWMWRIPLNNRTGSGIVYSSAPYERRACGGAPDRGQSGRRQDALARTPQAHVPRRAPDAILALQLRFAIGLASGFVEPLESTGIHLIQRAIMLLMEFFPDKSLESSSLRNAFNARMGETYDEVRDFIVLHYLLSQP